MHKRWRVGSLPTLGVFCSGFVALSSGHIRFVGLDFCLQVRGLSLALGLPDPAPHFDFRQINTVERHFLDPPLTPNAVIAVVGDRAVTALTNLVALPQAAPDPDALLLRCSAKYKC